MTPVVGRLSRWAGAAVLVGCLTFIVERLWRLDWSALQPHVSWSLAGALIASPLLFAMADHAFAKSWAETVDPDREIPEREIARIYGQGVLMKYLPGSVFQYFSRHAGGRKAGVAHSKLARATGIEVGLHLVSCLSVVVGFMLFARLPFMIAAGAFVLIGSCLMARRPLLRSLALQIAAFGTFALAAVLIGGVILPDSVKLGHFAALFLLAWLAGFVVPVAPGGLGVREAALLALAGTSLPAAGVLATALALRASSTLGDLAYGLIAQSMGRRSV